MTDPLATVRRRARWMYWTLGVLLVTVLAALFTTAVITQDATFLEPRAIFTALSLPLTAAGLMGGIICVMLTTDANALMRLVPERQKSVNRAVRNASAADLLPTEREPTWIYARTMAAIFRLQIVQFLLLFAGLAATRLADLFTPGSGLHTFDVIFLVCVFVVSAALVPFILHRAQRLQRFADEVEASRVLD
jgi:hypothetical protein